MRRFALVMMDSAQRERLRGALLGSDLDVAFTAGDGPLALEFLQETLVDVLFCDMVLPGMDGIALIQKIKTLPIATMPAVLMLSAAPMPVFEREAMNAGACGIVGKPLDPEALIERAGTLCVCDRLTRVGADSELIRRDLTELGFSVRHSGTYYLVEAILLASRDARLVDRLTTELYPLVGESFQTTGKRVEHAISRAVESAWSMGALERQHSAFGNTIDARRGKPVNGDMIARMAEWLRAKEL